MELPMELILLLKPLKKLPILLPIVVPPSFPMPPSYLASNASSITARNRDTQIYLPESMNVIQGISIYVWDEKYMVEITPIMRLELPS